MSSVLLARNERYRLMGLILRIRAVAYAIVGVSAFVALDDDMVVRAVTVVVLVGAALVPFIIRATGRYSGVRMSAGIDVMLSYFVWIAVPEAAAVTLVLTIWTVGAVEFFSKRSTANRNAAFVIALEISKVGLVVLAPDRLNLVDGPLVLLIVGRAVVIAASFVIMRGLDHYLHRLTAAAETSADRYRRLMESAPTAFLVLTDGEVRYANAAAVSLLSEDATPIEGVRYEDLLGEGYRSAFCEQVDRAEQRLEPFTMRGIPMRSATGVEIDVDAAGTPIDFAHELAIQIALQDVSAQRRAEDELARTKLNYRSFFERIPVALYRSRPSGEIIQANRALVELLGARSESDLIGRNAQDFYVEGTDREQLGEMLATQRVVVGYEAPMRTLQGSLIWVRDTTRLIESDIGEIYEGALIDVTGRRDIEDELWTRAVQQEAAASIGQTALEAEDISLVMRSVAETVARVLRTDAAVILERTAGGFALAGQSAGVELDPSGVGSIADRAHMTSAPVVLRNQSEVLFAAPDLARAGFASAIAVMIPGSDIAFGTLIALSVGERVFTSEDLNFLHSVANVLAAAADRASARSRLETLLQSKDAFVASVSHELRTPLTVVNGMALELAERWMELSEADMAEFTGMLVEQSQDMSDLIEDLLIAARANVGSVTVVNEPVELERHVHSVIAGFSSTPGKSVRAEVHTGIVDADPVRIRQILRNLVTNAVRYGGPNIDVVMSSSPGTHVLEVIDDGKGIPEADRERVFAPYERAHNAAGQPGSVGLGLTVSRTLADLMGGSLTYHFDGRSRFRLELSRNTRAEAARAEAARAEAGEIAMPAPNPVGIGRIGVDVGFVD